MAVAIAQKTPQAIGVVGEDGIAYRGPSRQRLPPGLYLGQAAEDAELRDLVEHRPVAEDRAEHRVDKRETIAREIRSPAEFGLKVGELAMQLRGPAVHRGGVRRRIEAPDVVEHRRA